MKFVLAPDSFKESMTASEVAEAMEKGIKKVIPDAICVKIPMADGGEGTTESLIEAMNGQIDKVEVMGPLGSPVQALLGVLEEEKLAVIEMASASGLQLIPKEERNPLITSSYGTGQLIKAALDRGVEKIVIGIGGSATNDGGAGMFQALGGSLLDSQGRELSRGGGELNKLHSIDMTNLDPRLAKTKIEVACDVNNPLIGKRGASHIFGPQKGGSPEMIKLLDKNLRHYGNIIEEQLGIEVNTIEGAGAAGGLGAGLMAFLSGKLIKGVDLLINHTKLEEHLQDADYVWTGEGSIDGQTLGGKTPYGVASLAKEYDITTIALAGSIGDDVSSLYDHGIDSIIGILPSPVSLEKALRDGAKNIENTSENIARLLLSLKK